MDEIDYIETVSYLSSSVTKVATSVTSTTATFNGVNIKQAPVASGLPTTKENFNFYTNGHHISSEYVSSVVNSGNDVIVTFSGLGYILETTDTVVGVGKFLELV